MTYEFAATQDLHGYGKPWAPGAGKNLLNPALYRSYPVTVNGVTASLNADETISLSGTATAVAYIAIVNYLDLSDYGFIEPDTTYFLSGGISGDIRLTFGVSGSGTDYADIGQGKAMSFTAEQIESLQYRVLITVANGTNVDGITIKPMIEKGSTKTAWEPYANVCMPEGFNIWDPTNQKYIQVYAGYVNANTRELYLRPVYQEYDGEELVGPWMSSLDEYTEEGTPTTGAFVIDFGGELTSYEITAFMLQTLLDSLGIRQHFTNGAGLLNSLMDQAQGRVRSEEELLHLSRPLKVIAIGDQLPAGLTFKPISKDVLPGLPGKFIR